MNEAKHELKSLSQWKYNVKVLQEAREDLYNTNRSESFIITNTSRTNKSNDCFNHIVDKIVQYDYLIKEYQFFINRLERAIELLLNEEQREVCIIYANYPNNYNKREFEALERGYTRSTYYNVLNKAVHILNDFLCILDIQT